MKVDTPSDVCNPNSSTPPVYVRIYTLSIGYSLALFSVGFAAWWRIVGGGYGSAFVEQSAF